MEVAAAFGVHHATTVAKTVERLHMFCERVTAVEPQKEGADASGGSDVTWATVKQWAAEVHFVVPAVSVELPVADLDAQLEDIFDEDENI